MGPGSRSLRSLVRDDSEGDTMTDITGRNIVILCDGTGNEISENISNVLKLYRCMRKTDKTQPHQVVFYDPGVGAVARPDPWHKLRQDFSAIPGARDRLRSRRQGARIVPLPDPQLPGRR